MEKKKFVFCNLEIIDSENKEGTIFDEVIVCLTQYFKKGFNFADYLFDIISK